MFGSLAVLLVLFPALAFADIGTHALTVAQARARGAR